MNECFFLNKLTLDENKHTLVLSVINRNQTGIYVCQVLNEVGEGQANISVTVQCKYAPNLTITKQTNYSANKIHACF
jgi:hypothetical protein